jgi:hypothetical protein
MEAEKGAPINWLSLHLVIGLGATLQLLEHGAIVQMLEFIDTLSNAGGKLCLGEVRSYMVIPKSLNEMKTGKR